MNNKLSSWHVVRPVSMNAKVNNNILGPMPIDFAETRKHYRIVSVTVYLSTSCVFGYVGLTKNEETTLKRSIVVRRDHCVYRIMTSLSPDRLTQRPSISSLSERYFERRNLFSSCNSKPSFL